MKVNVAPDMGMYNLLRIQGYDPAYALAEFIDNALQAFLNEPASSRRKRGALKVDVKFYSAAYVDAKLTQSVLIIDDGPGIPAGKLAAAMKPAKKSEMKGLSEFGIGMKAAAVWFTDTWSLSTVPEGESKCHSLTFDLPQLLSTAKEEIEVKSKASTQSRGTTIILSKSRRTVDSDRYKTICTELRDLYQRFTMGPSPKLILKAYFDDTPIDLKWTPDEGSNVLEAPSYKLAGKSIYSYGKDKTWSVSIDTTFLGAKVTGTISLLERGSYKTNPGLVMFRHERVVAGTTQRPFVPVELFGTGNKYARQRVRGELFADDLPVTYTKDGFEFNTADFVSQLLTNNELKELLEQAEAYRSDKEKVERHFKSEADLSKFLGKTAAATKTSKKATGTTKPAGKGTEGSSGSDSSSKAGGGGSTARPPAPAPSPPEPLVHVLTQLQASSHTTAGIQAVISEMLLLYRARREIAIAMCLRAVVETGLLLKVQRSFPAEYSRVAEKGVASLINYLSGNAGTFFPTTADYRVKKAITSISGGHQMDIVLLNNAAHGHYQPSMAELNKFASNLEEILKWAYL